MNICRKFLTASLSVASLDTRKKFAAAAVLGGDGLGYTVELRDGEQIEVGRAHCKYCARVEALQQLDNAATVTP
jgi:hypothetical protein